MKKGMLFLSILLVSVGLMYSAEITLGFGWRISDSGLVLGEYSFPFSNRRITEYKDEVYGIFRRTETTDYTLSKNINPFQRRAYIVFGVDWFLYKKQVSLGFELSAGYFQREYEVFLKGVTEVDGDVVAEYTRNYKETTIVIPANFFLITKYKFDVKNWFRPYLGIGGGLNATVFLKGITEWDENDVESGEKSFTYSGAFLAIAGADFFFSKKARVFIELRYVKPLGEGKNFREQMTLGIGFRFI